mmetsp:Transcript_62575/g.182967  ORF Transcript_62575/g.182967 Transcript_62575/m.182967 type:complete len:203 (-) Transcript_62575:15-623(-)
MLSLVHRPCHDQGPVPQREVEPGPSSLHGHVPVALPSEHLLRERVAHPDDVAAAAAAPGRPGALLLHALVEAWGCPPFRHRRVRHRQRGVSCRTLCCPRRGVGLEGGRACLAGLRRHPAPLLRCLPRRWPLRRRGPCRGLRQSGLGRTSSCGWSIPRGTSSHVVAHKCSGHGRNHRNSKEAHRCRHCPFHPSGGLGNGPAKA